MACTLSGSTWGAPDRHQSTPLTRAVSGLQRSTPETQSPLSSLDFPKQDGALDVREFSIAMHLIELILNGGAVPVALDQAFIASVAQGLPRPGGNPKENRWFV